MSGRRLTPEEKTAGEIVAKRLGGQAIERDGERGSHDFDIALPHERTAALEVTSAADQGLEVLMAQAGRVREVPTLRDHWWLVLPFDGHVDVPRACAGAVPQLEALERLGVGEVGDFVPEGTLPEAAAHAASELRQLGIRRARPWGAPKPGEVARLFPCPAGGVGSSFYELNALVEECAKRKVTKLIAAERDERHLFIWTRGSVPGAELAIATLPPPPTAPELPDGVDVVWVGTHDRLLYLRPPHGWEQLA